MKKWCEWKISVEINLVSSMKKRTMTLHYEIHLEHIKADHKKRNKSWQIHGWIMWFHVFIFGNSSTQTVGNNFWITLLQKSSINVPHVIRSRTRIFSVLIINISNVRRAVKMYGPQSKSYYNYWYYDAYPSLFWTILRIITNKSCKNGNIIIEL